MFLLRLLVLLLAFVVCTEPSIAEKLDSQSTVGVVLPLTGEAATFGVAAKNGMQMAYQSLPKEDQALFKLVYEDDNFSPKKALSAFNKLRSIDRIDILVNAGSQSGNAMSPLAEHHKIPYIAIATDPEIVKNKKFVVSFWVTAEEEAKVIIPEAIKRNYTKRFQLH